MQAIGFTLVGRLSDLCGRRYFIIGGNLCGLIGAIICCTAQSIPTVIGGNVLLGLACSVQTSVPFVLGELIPIKHRFLATGGMYFFVLPGAVFGPSIAYAFVGHTAAGWRWVYYFMLITNSLAVICWIIFYHPPTFVMLTRKTRMQMVKDFDWLGFVLFTGGLLTFLMGLSWGGSVHPWVSGQVLGTMITGAVALIVFICWEAFVPLKEPLMPVHMFKNKGMYFPVPLSCRRGLGLTVRPFIAWVIVMTLTALSASLFYGFAIVFPQMVFGVYTSNQGYGAILSCLLPGAFTLGVIVSGVSRYVGHWRVMMIACAVMAMAFLGAIACATVDNKSTILGLTFVGALFAGIIEGVGVTGTSVTVKNQAEIGTGVGIAATIKSVIATIATTIYVTVLTNRTATTIPAKVPPALVAAGLPAARVPAFITELTTGVLGTNSDFSPKIIAVGVRAYREALVLAFNTVFLTTLAFSGSVLILTCFFPDLTPMLTGDVVALLHVKKERDEIVAQIQAEEHGMSVPTGVNKAEHAV